MRRRVQLGAAVALALGLALWAGSVTLRSRALYRSLKRNDRGWSAPVHRVDPELGYAPIPGVRAAHVFPLGPPVPMRFSAEGFRVPVDAPEELELRRPLVLALGCSFTYGDACLAEDTFADRVAAELGGTSLNAGVCGYGYAQMVLLARRLVPRYRPDVVLFQTSPWLWERALKPWAESYFGLVPVPWIAAPPAGRPLDDVLRPPLFPSRAVGLPVDRYRRGPASTGELLGFVTGPGGALFVHDDLRALPHRLGRALGRGPAAPDREAVLDALLGEVARTCAVNRGRLLVVRIGAATPRDDERVGRLPGARLVDATTALEARLPERTRAAYLRAYAHWRGDPPRLVDTHLNPAGHAVVAEAILAALR